MKLILKAFAFFWLLSEPSDSYAQLLPDTLYTVDHPFNVDIYQGPVAIGTNRTRSLMEGNGRALDHYNKAISTTQIRGFLLGVSALGILYSAAVSVAEDKPAIGPGLAGVACMALCVPLSSSIKKSKKKAVTLHNETVRLR